MLKKLLLSAVVLAISASAYANSAPYIGASFGEQTNTTKYKNFRGLPFDVFVGYGGDVGNGIYLGGEIFGTLATGTITDDGVKSTYGYGVSLIPGLLISDHTMGYMRLGIVRTRFTPGGVTARTMTGEQAGLGIQTSLMQNWDLRGEYDYTAYNNLRGVTGSLRADQFNLGLVYKFD